jgi:hypothetical protein
MLLLLCAYLPAKVLLCIQLYHAGQHFRTNSQVCKSVRLKDKSSVRQVIRVGPRATEDKRETQKLKATSEDRFGIANRGVHY